MTNTKREIQESRYEFPYHYLPSVNPNWPMLGRILPWGLEYITYIWLVIDIINKLKVSSVLDVGCGDGRLLNLLRNNKNLKTLVGVDTSERALMFARALNPTIQFFLNIKETKGNFECITLVEVLEHIPDKEIPGALNSIYYKLKDGGFLIISVPTTNVPVNPKHYKHYDSLILKEALGKKWRMIYEGYFVKYKNHPLSKFFIFLRKNKYFTLLIPSLLKVEFRYRFNAGKEDGRHLIAIFMKKKMVK